MTIMTSTQVEAELLDFVGEAADTLSKNPEYQTVGDLKPGSFLALRWGITGRSVLVVKLDEFFERRVYQDEIKEK